LLHEIIKDGDRCATVHSVSIVFALLVADGLLWLLLSWTAW